MAKTKSTTRQEKENEPKKLEKWKKAEASTQKMTAELEGLTL